MAVRDLSLRSFEVFTSHVSVNKPQIIPELKAGIQLFFLNFAERSLKKEECASEVAKDICLMLCSTILLILVSALSNKIICNF